MIETVQELMPDVDIAAVAQDANNLLGLGNQPTEDAQVMSKQLDTQELPQPTEGSETASLSSMLARKIAKRKELAGIGQREAEQRAATRVSEDVQIKSEILRETPVEALDESLPCQINFDAIKSNEDLRKEFGVLNEMNRDAIQTQRREVVPDEELRNLAYDLSTDPNEIKKVLGLKPGEILPLEYIL